MVFCRSCGFSQGLLRPDAGRSSDRRRLPRKLDLPHHPGDVINDGLAAGPEVGRERWLTESSRAGAKPRRPALIESATTGASLGSPPRSAALGECRRGYGGAERGCAGCTGCTGPRKARRDALRGLWREPAGHWTPARVPQVPHRLRSWSPTRCRA